MTQLVVTLDVHKPTATLTDPHDVADALFHDDVPTFSPGDAFEFEHYRQEIAGTFVSAEWGPETPTWAIDQEGHVFFEGRWVFTVDPMVEVDRFGRERFEVHGLWVMGETADHSDDVLQTFVSMVPSIPAMSRDDYEAVRP